MTIVFYYRSCQDGSSQSKIRFFPLMADVIPFRRPSLKEKHKGNTLCRHGHHKWAVDTSTRFDVKQGELVTTYCCSRCGKQKQTKH